MSAEQEDRADMTKIRDIDLKVLSNIYSGLDAINNVKLVVTGSYAIEALTESPLVHEDIDVNIFTSNLPSDISRIASIMMGMSAQGLKLQLFKQTEDRLEYDILPEQADSRRLEIQFVNVERFEESETEFRLVGGGIIPTVTIPLKDSKGQEQVFRVKSLPYSIATWAIRVSGAGENPKREIRESDLEHLKLLLSAAFQEKDVLVAMSQHPQMPGNVSELEVFRQAIEKLKI